MYTAPASLPVALSYARSIAPRRPSGSVKNPPSPAITSDFVTSVPIRPSRPVRGIVRPLSAGWLRTLSGVSPCAICQTSSPLFKSIAVMRPYGGLIIGSPCTNNPLLLSPPAPTVGPVACPGLLGSGAWPVMKFISDLRFSSGGTRPSALACVFENTYMIFVSGSYEPPCQFAPPVAAGRISVARGPSHLLTTGGVKIGPILYFETNSTASWWSCGVKSIRSSSDTPCRSKAGGLVGKGCVGEYHSPGPSPIVAGLSVFGRVSWQVVWSNTYTQPCFVGCASALIARPLTTISVRIGAHGISMSQMPWWTS